MRNHATPKPPVIVIIALDPKYLPTANAFLFNQHRLTAKRVSKFIYHSATGLRLTKYAKKHLDDARSTGRPIKVIIISDSEESLTTVETNLSQMTWYEKKMFEYHRISRAGDVSPDRIGIFVPEFMMKKEEK